MDNFNFAVLAGTELKNILNKINANEKCRNKNYNLFDEITEIKKQLKKETESEDKNE